MTWHRRGVLALAATVVIVGFTAWWLHPTLSEFLSSTPETEPEGQKIADAESSDEENVHHEAEEDKEEEDEVTRPGGCDNGTRIVGGSCAEVDLEEVRLDANQGGFDPNADIVRRVQAFQDFRRDTTTQEEINEDTADDTLSLPEKAKVYVKTFGCSHNVSDSEFMLGLLKAAGYQLVPNWEDCDIAVLNSCTVKNPSQDGAVNLAVKVKTASKMVVMAGCVVQADRKIPQLQEVSAIGVKQLDKVVEAVAATLEGNVYVDVTSNRDLPTLSLPKVRRNQFVEIVPLSTGCLGSCTYCKTRHARGDLGSYTTEAILDRIKLAIEEGVQQIWLTSEDTGAYGLDIGSNVADLLEGILNVIETAATTRHIMVRLGMTNPPYILSHLDRLARILESPHFFEFLHIPVQTGSNKVLLDMRREYTREEFEVCVDRLRAHLPQIHLSTDFICGFPDETDADHAESLDLLRKYQFPTLNISQFYPRPGTPAANRPRVDTRVVKQRSQEMTKVFFSYTTLEPWVGRRGRVWFSEFSDRSPHVVGHTKQYIKVLVEHDPSLIGEERICEFTGCSKWHLTAKVIGTFSRGSSAPTTDAESALLVADSPAEIPPEISSNSAVEAAADKEPLVDADGELSVVA
eukprot:Protomagalhaensia_sp_Gyna_25__440@NODE_1207_length_2068_cov_21_260227_g961_i0_p1_GENE_NODE_1207_length_2068_cov_21_260227_g961_i0NODE_1207_length_2068_cov_21_260227_g961_i0_p1_ORF_typecomplete_len631_score126_96UPF0004/PF00919_20/4_6e26Radical_SAM/PF04055_21/3e19TRAM/PF01938_20/0_049_NODE_1207_length_2068_cov_21_260227_g961_i01752067